jgi:hypothetical protein
MGPMTLFWPIIMPVPMRAFQIAPPLNDTDGARKNLL